MYSGSGFTESTIFYFGAKIQTQNKLTNTEPKLAYSTKNMGKGRCQEVLKNPKFYPKMSNKKTVSRLLLRFFQPADWPFVTD